MSAVDRLRDAAALRLCRVSVDPADLRDVLVYYDDHEHKARAAEAEVARLRAALDESEGQCMELREALRRQVVGWRSAQAELDAARAEIDRLRDER